MFCYLAHTAIFAHHGPEEMIPQLDKQIAQEPSAILFSQRASEHLQLGHYQQAEEDILAALKIAPRTSQLLQQLSEIQLLRKRYSASYSSASEAIQLAPDDDTRAYCLMLRCRILIAQKAMLKAQKDCQQAFALAQNPEIAWHLTRSEINLQLGLTQRRAEQLEIGYQQSKSAALFTAWIEALLDDKQALKALPIIQEQLDAARLKSSWLQRRARAHQQLANFQQAQDDYNAALKEINSRLNLQRPDTLLLLQKEQISKQLSSLAASESL